MVINGKSQVRHIPANPLDSTLRVEDAAGYQGPDEEGGNGRKSLDGRPVGFWLNEERERFRSPRTSWYGPSRR